MDRDGAPPVSRPKKTTGGPYAKLVVNADEFGLFPDVSTGIITAHRDGIVTSTSVLGNTDDLPDASRLLRENPTLGVGIQLCLIRGRPVTHPNDVRTLLAAHGGFPEHAREVFGAWLGGRLRQVEIEREFAAQVERALAAGLAPDHLDTQHHLGFLPPVGLALEATAQRFGILGVRSAAEKPTLTWVTELPRGALAALMGGLSWMTRRKMGTLRHGPESHGYVESGQLDEVRILEILGRLGPGSHELICHPGESDDARPGLGPLPGTRFRRARELAALTSPVVKQAVRRRNLQLCRWSDLF